MPTLDLTGQRFGRWLVLSPSGKQGQYTTWFVRCDCGVEKTVLTTNLRRGDSKSCGCLNRERASERLREAGHKDLVGQTFKRWTVIARDGHKGTSMAWLCRCECGTERRLSTGQLNDPRSSSCGCYNRECASSRNRKVSPGMVFGRLTVVEQAGYAGRKIQWRCQCECGGNHVTTGALLLRGDTASCGCLRKETTSRLGSSKAIDLTGQTFNGILVLSQVSTYKWNCRCHCGKKITVFTANLKKMQSCGCLTKEILSKAQTKHGLSKDPSYLRALKALYKYRRKLRTPLWVDTDRLTEIYMNCPEGYQVDHIIPLSGEKVSGLHVPENLQYLSAEENNRKRNKFTPFIISISESNETITTSA